MGEIICLMIILQGLREVLFNIIRPLVPDTMFCRKMITMVIMIAFTILVVGFAKWKKQSLSVFPERFTRFYSIATCVILALYVTAPANYTEGMPAVMTLIYASIVTPIYEELLFRGYIWNRMSDIVAEEKYVYMSNVVLFAVWHIGYMIPQIMAGNWVAVMWKVAVGIGYGIVLGFVRWKTKNCYATILLHGGLNLFMV